MRPADEYLTIEELAARLKINPTEGIKALATEIAAQLMKEYLTIDELAERLSLNRSTVKNKMAAGVFWKGIHYFSPKGLGPRFKWSAVQAWMEGSENSEAAGIPMRRGYSLNPAASVLRNKSGLL